MIKDKPYKKICEKWGRIKYDSLRGYLFEYKPYFGIEQQQALISVLYPYLDKCEGKDVIITLEVNKDE